MNILTAPKKQRGATLLISLILLLLLTILALAAAHRATLQQRMASTLQQQNLAFQAAESGIQAAILQLQDESARPQQGSPKYLASEAINMVSWSNTPINCDAADSKYYYCAKVEQVDCAGSISGSGGIGSIGEGGNNINLTGGTCYAIISTGRYQTAKAIHQQGYMF